MSRFREKHYLLIFCLYLTVSLFIFSFVSCGGSQEDQPDQADVLPEQNQQPEQPVHHEQKPLIIGGFDSVRGGDTSLTDPLNEDIRNAITDAFPGTTFMDSDVIKDNFLSGIDILVLNSSTSCCIEIVPLSVDEQNCVLNFVKSGKGALIFSDNEAFGGSQTAMANKSVINPFGLGTQGVLVGEQTATVTDPSAHPVTAGPFGLVSTIYLFFPGWFTTLGPYAKPLATLDENEDKCNLAVIETGSISPNSGRVVFFSDTLTTHESLGDLFRLNEVLIMNSIAFVGNRDL